MKKTSAAFHRYILPAFAILCLPCALLAQEKPLPPDAASPDVKESITYDLGNRLLTVQRVTENTIPIRLAAQDHQPPVSTFPKEPEVVDAHLDHSLALGGTVYRTGGGLTRSLITYWTGSGSEPIVFWSSIDWNLLTTETPVTPKGDHYSLFLLLDTEDLAETARLAGEQGEPYTPPQVPNFSTVAASYRIVSGKTTPEILNELNELHAIHDREYQSLIALWKNREEERVAAEAAAKLPQPPPENIVSQYREMTPEELKNR